MDLSTLPNEMFSNILKYANFGRLMMLRKVNQKIDNLAKRNKLCETVPVESFEIEGEHEDPIMGNITFQVKIYVDCEFYGPKFVEFKLQPNTEVATALQFYLPKITVKKDVHIQHININEDDMDVLYKQRKRLNRAIRLTFIEARFNIGNDFAGRFYREIFPNVHGITLNGDGGQEIFNSEVFANRKYSFLSLHENKPDVNYVLDDNFLIKVVANFRDVYIHCLNGITFTLNGVQNLLKACIAADGAFKNGYHLGMVDGLGVPLNNLSEIFDKIIEEGLGGNKDIYENSLKCKLDVISVQPVPYCKFTFEDRMNAPYLWFYYVAE